MNIDKYISELLFSHDCVIIPEFGGFVANYSPARIHPTQHTFTPPSKSIGFNRNLKSNDGLLANAIATACGVSFSEASRIIGSYVDDCGKTLKSGRRLIITDVGMLYFDVENNLQFEPDRTINYLPDAFGLTTFQSPAIRRDNYQAQFEKKFIDREPVAAPRRKINIKKYVALAVAAVPVIFAAIWIPLKTDLLQDVNYSALNPFGQKEKAKYEVRTASASVLTLSDVKEEEADHGTAGYYLTLTPGTQPVAVAASEPAPVAERDTTYVAAPEVQPQASGSYHIVAGCFSIYENAERYVSQLRGSNSSASIIGQTANGLHIVSVGSFSEKDAAMNALTEARAQNPDVWVMRKDM